MAANTANTDFATALVDALAQLGLRHVCISPGSRSTPLAMAFAVNPGITDWSHHDERSGSFYALGIARATRVPVAVVSTSGTAAAEFHPAVIEARLGRVPLLVLTADRPPELRDVGAPQAIDQIKLYGDAAKWFHEVGVPDDSGVLAASAGSLAARAWAEMVEAPAGPVHLNLPFREPLLGETGRDPATARVPAYVPGALLPTDAQVSAAIDLLGGRRTLVIAGPQPDPALPEPLAALAAASRLPVIADPLSGLRTGAHDLSRVVAAGDLLAGAGFLDRQLPEAVLRLGAVPTSKALWRWLEDHPEVHQVVVDDAGWRDPMGSAALMLRTDPAALVAALAESMPAAPTGWDESWVAADRAVTAAADDAIDAAGFPTEPGIVRTLARSLPAASTLTVASSMPIRDVDAFFPTSARPVTFLANRGANGIDGFLSTGFGAAQVASGPAYLLAGDLSVVHDVGALASAARLGVPAMVIAVNNDGGGIFHFLPQSGTEHFERHFGTPHGLDLVRIAEALGVAATRAGSFDDLERAVATPATGPRFIEVRTDREANVAVHRAIRDAAARALA